MESTSRDIKNDTTSAVTKENPSEKYSKRKLLVEENVSTDECLEKKRSKVEIHEDLIEKSKRTSSSYFMEKLMMEKDIARLKNELSIMLLEMKYLRDLYDDSINNNSTDF